VQRFDLAALARDLNQLWAEAAVREAAGASIRLDQSLWAAAAQEQEARVSQDVWQEALDEKLAPLGGAQK
jgi:hypothetical protein